MWWNAIGCFDHEARKTGWNADAKENMRPGDINRNDGGKYLQLQLTVEDEGVFTTPWTATITYGRGPANGRKLSAPKTFMNTITTRTRRSRARTSRISSRLRGPRSGAQQGASPCPAIAGVAAALPAATRTFGEPAGAKKNPGVRAEGDRGRARRPGRGSRLQGDHSDGRRARL